MSNGCRDYRRHNNNDYHQHLFSPEAAPLVTGNPSPAIGARDVIALLDSAGIQRALILSVAYTLGKAA